MAGEILEQHIFISDRKDKEVIPTVLDILFSFDVAEINIDYTDRPDATFTTINDRTKKILSNLDSPDKIASVHGYFNYGGSFELKGGNLSISVTEDEYNYELIHELKNILSPVFSLWIFKNPYIWGVNIYENYERQHFFDVRNFSYRAKLLEEPEVDIYRRDNGVIHKYRFFLKDDFEPEEGIKFLVPFFTSLKEGLQKRNYEPLEVLNLYCTDKAAFRRIDPRTKLGKEIKSILHPH